MSDILIDTAQLASISGSWNGSAFAYTMSVTVASGQNMLTLCMRGNSTHVYGISGLKFNGVDMTQRRVGADGDAWGEAIWDLLNPAVGTYNITFTYSSDTTLRMVATPLSNVDATTPRRTIPSAKDAWSTTPSITVTTVAGDVMLAVASCVSAPTAAGGQTSLFSGDTYVEAAYKVATTTSTTISFTQASSRWGMVAVAYIPAADEGDPEFIAQLTGASPLHSLISGGLAR